jgi:cell wall-associated NlpC family hydrolase
MNETVKKLVDFAKQFIGTPYVYGAPRAHYPRTPETFDCSSFIQYVFAHVGIELPRSSILQAKDLQGTEIAYAGMTSLLPGDLLFMRSDKGYYDDEAFGGREIYVGHVVLYIGEGRIIHAKSSLGGVVLQELEELLSDPRYAITYIKRLF